MQIASIRGGGFSVRITLVERSTVRSIGDGQILRVRTVPTKRIAQQCEIVIRHDHGFESTYNIVDQTPHATVDAPLTQKFPGGLVQGGSELYEIVNGGTLHFQLFRAGKLVDPRLYIHAEFQGTTTPHQ